MKIQLNLTSWIFVILLCVVSCSENKHLPGDTIPREQFMQLYIELLVAGERGDYPTPDSAKSWNKKALVDSILSKYDVTEAQVQGTIQEYCKDPQLWKEFYDDVIKRLEEFQREAQTKTES